MKEQIDELKSLLKAGKRDISKLTPKIITDKRGHKRKVYVRTMPKKKEPEKKVEKKEAWKKEFESAGGREMIMDTFQSHDYPQSAIDEFEGMSDKKLLETFKKEGFGIEKKEEEKKEEAPKEDVIKLPRFPDREFTGSKEVKELGVYSREKGYSKTKQIEYKIIDKKTGVEVASGWNKTVAKDRLKHYLKEIKTGEQLDKKLKEIKAKREEKPAPTVPTKELEEKAKKIKEKMISIKGHSETPETVKRTIEGLKNDLKTAEGGKDNEKIKNQLKKEIEYLEKKLKDSGTLKKSDGIDKLRSLLKVGQQ